jgi:signal transduction histidine kinase
MARILLAARNRGEQDAIRSMLASASPHTIVAVGCGADALLEAAESAVDVALVDVDLPDLDGYEVGRRLQVSGTVGALPVIMLSRSDRMPEHDSVAEVLTRPFDAQVLVARIEAALRLRSLGSRLGKQAQALSDKTGERSGRMADLANELSIERDALRETFNVFQDGLFLIDANGAILIENTAGRELLAQAPRALSDTGDGSPRRNFHELLAEVAAEAVRQGSTTSRTLLWRTRQLDLRASLAAGGRVLVYVRDVTEERDRELRRLQSEKLASIGMLAAGVAHEINNPASFVLANVDSLATMLRKLDDSLRAKNVFAQDGALANQLFDAMTVVQESKEGMARIHRIARDLHSFSRVDDDANALSDVNAAVDSALTMLRSELRYRATVERSLRATQLVRASAARLGQVFLNLLVNAAHALADLHPRRNRLYVRSRDEGTQVVVEIEDNGPGIPPAIMSRIFESFFTTKPPELGTGLGLPISLDIVRRAGGDLTAESEPGRGALFRVRLPAAMGVPAVKTRTVPSLKAIHRRRVLAIDDEALLLKAFQRMLVSHHDIETKLGAREALRCFGQDRAFDVVLCDLQMPDMSGVELYQAVKQQWPKLAARFIFITGGAFSAEARRFLEDGDIACINKPFQLRELLELIEARTGA